MNSWAKDLKPLPAYDKIGRNCAELRKRNQGGNYDQAVNRKDSEN